MDMYAVLEIWSWLDKGMSLDSAGAWTEGGKYVAPEALLPYLAQQIHSLGHVGAQSMVHQFSSKWWNPKFRTYVFNVMQHCFLCQANNKAAGVPTPATHTQALVGQFKHL